MVAKHLIFTGQVQGVGFRYASQRTASRHNLKGWVRNLPNGSVEMVAQGENQDIDDCINEIQESFAGYIRDTEINDIPPNPGYTRFNITY